MNVLIACEESQTVCKAFRERGHNAFSCDIQKNSGGHPEWHIMGDVLPVLNGNCDFVTEDGRMHTIETPWDLVIAHPPCTYLTNTGSRWFDIEKYGDKARQRYKDRYSAIVFFMQIASCNAPRLAIENPVGVMSTAWRKADCVIQPYMFGDDARKTTCLWLKGLPPLRPTKIIKPTLVKAGSHMVSPWMVSTWVLPPSERARVRSVTYPGIARAMAEQWGAGEYRLWD